MSLLQQLSHLRAQLQFSFSLSLLPFPLGAQGDCSSSKFSGPHLTSRVQGFFLCSSLSWWEIFSFHEPPRDSLPETIGPELGHGTPEPVTAEGSRIPCAIPGVPQLFPEQNPGLTGRTVEGRVPVRQTPVSVCQNVHLRVKNRFQKVMIHFVPTWTTATQPGLFMVADCRRGSLQGWSIGSASA